MGKTSIKSIKEMSLTEIFETTNAIFYETDIANFCNDIKVINKFMLLRKKDNNYKEIMNFLIKNGDKIDKEKLVFNIYINYNQNIPQIEQTINKLCRELESIIRFDSQLSKSLGGNIRIAKIKDLKNFLSLNQDKLTFVLRNTKNDQLVKSVIDRLDEIALLEEELIKQQEYKEKAKKLLKDTDSYLDEVVLIDNHLKLNIYSSKEEYEGIHKFDRRKKNKLNKIDNAFGSDNKGLVYLVQPLILSDLEYIFPEPKIGGRLRENILCNSLISEGRKTLEELEKIKQQNFKEYENTLRKASRDIYLNELRNEVIENYRYIDLDKLFLISIYRFEEYIEESENYEPQYYEEYRNLVFYVMSQIENGNVSINGEMQSIVGKEKHVEYSMEDAERFMKRLTDKEYIYKDKIKEIKSALLKGDMSVRDVQPNILSALDVSDEELDRIINISTENAISIIEISGIDEENIMGILRDKDTIDPKLFLYVINNEKISMESALELYSSGKVREEYFENLIYNQEFIDFIDINNINKEYMELKSQNKLNDENKKHLESKIELYKYVYINNKSDVEKEDTYNDVMYTIAETFEDENDILYYYKKGLVSLDLVAEWCGEELIESLYKKGKIQLEDLEKYKKDLKLLEKAVIHSNLSFEKKLEYVKKKCISKEGIISIFQNSGLYRTDLEKKAKELLNTGIISQYLFEQLIKRDMKGLEEKAGHKFSSREAMKQLRGCDIPWEIQLSKKDIRDHFKDDETDKPIKPTDGGKSNKIISPIARYEFLKLLKCNIPNISYEKIGEDNPFYDYNFYIIQEEILGEKPLRDAIIIIERFFKDREKAMENANGDMETALNDVNNWSKDNATYIMNYEDYLVLQGKQKELQETKKRNVVREVDGAIYTANHRSGSWAVSLLYKIAQSKAGDSFKEFKGEDKTRQVIDWLRTLYTAEELDEIVKLMKKIDNEEFTYEEKNGTYKLIDTGYDYSDDSEER